MGQPIRPDQAYDPPATQVTPSGRAGIFRGRLVEIFGSGGSVGLFVYNGTPSSSNPPVGWIVAPGTTKDPFGNTVSAVAGFGTPAAAHFGINSSGDIFLVNSTPVTIFHGRSSDGSFFFYDTSGESLNHLTASIVAPPNPVTDAVGNTAQPGITAYNLVGGIVTYVQLVNSLINFQATATNKGQIGRDTNGFFVSDTTNSRSIYFQLNDSALTVRAIRPGTTNTFEAWQTISPVAGFSAGGTTPRFQFEPINGGRVRLSGAINLTANQIAGTTFFTLPANYIPSRTLHFVTQSNLSGLTLTANSSLTVTSGGALQITVAGTNGNFLALDGVCFELD